jgi:hypothetical protein
MMPSMSNAYREDCKVSALERPSIDVQCLKSIAIEDVAITMWRIANNFDSLEAKQPQRRSKIGEDSSCSGPFDPSSIPHK